MRIYLAARYGRRLEMLDYADDLRRAGHEVVSTWIDGHNEWNSKHGAQADEAADASERAAWAACRAALEAGAFPAGSWRHA